MSNGLISPAPIDIEYSATTTDVTTTATPVNKLRDGIAKTRSTFQVIAKDFGAFIKRGNVVDLAVGIIMGAAFTAVVTSLVTDLISPILGYASQKSLANNFLVMRCPDVSKLGCVTGASHNYTTILQASTDGAVTWNWGNFINTVINFILVALVVFTLIRVYTSTFLRNKIVEVKTKTCDVWCVLPFLSLCSVLKTFFSSLEDCHILAKKCKHCSTTFTTETSIGYLN